MGQAAAERRRAAKATLAKAKGSGPPKRLANAMVDFVLTDLLAGSLRGHAITALVTCLS